MSELTELGVVETSTSMVPVVDGAQIPATPEERLEFTQGVRFQLVDALIDNGKVPTDKDGVTLLLNTLKGIDDQTLGVMRQKTDNQAGARDQLVAQALIELARQKGGRSQLRVEDPLDRAKVIKPSDADLPEIHTVDGETETGTHAITYNDLAAKFSRGNVAALEHNP